MIHSCQLKEVRATERGFLLGIRKSTSGLGWEEWKHARKKGCSQNVMPKRQKQDRWLESGSPLRSRSCSSCIRQRLQTDAKLGYLQFHTPIWHWWYVCKQAATLTIPNALIAPQRNLRNCAATVSSGVCPVRTMVYSITWRT